MSYKYQPGGNTKKINKPIYVDNINDDRYKAYRDSLDLFNFTKLQRQLERPSNYSKKSFLDQLIGTLTPEGEKNRAIITKRAQEILDTNTDLKPGLHKTNLPSYVKMISTKSDYDSNGSYDIHHPNIAPKGWWMGTARNNDYSNVEPVQPVIYRPKDKSVPVKTNPVNKPKPKKTFKPLNPEIIAKQKLIGVPQDGIWGPISQKAWEEYQKTNSNINNIPTQSTKPIINFQSNKPVENKTISEPLEVLPRQTKYTQHRFVSDYKGPTYEMSEKEERNYIPGLKYKKKYQPGGKKTKTILELVTPEQIDSYNTEVAIKNNTFKPSPTIKGDKWSYNRPSSNKAKTKPNIDYNYTAKRDNILEPVFQHPLASNTYNPGSITTAQPKTWYNTYFNTPNPSGGIKFLGDLGNAALIVDGGYMLKNGAKYIGKYAITKTPLRNAYKLNPFAKTAEKIFTKGNLKNNIPISNPEFIQRGVADKAAIDDLLNTGIVRNRLSAGLPSKNRWGENVYWGEEGDVLASNNYNIIAKNSKKLKNKPVTYEDIKDIQIREADGKYTSLPNWKNRINKPHWLKGYKKVNTPEEFTTLYRIEPSNWNTRIHPKGPKDDLLHDYEDFYFPYESYGKWFESDLNRLLNHKKSVAPGIHFADEINLFTLNVPKADLHNYSVLRNPEFAKWSKSPKTEYIYDFDRAITPKITFKNTKEGWEKIKNIFNNNSNSLLINK